MQRSPPVGEKASLARCVDEGHNGARRSPLGYVGIYPNFSECFCEVMSNGIVADLANKARSCARSHDGSTHIGR